MGNIVELTPGCRVGVIAKGFVLYSLVRDSQVPRLVVNLGKEPFVYTTRYGPRIQIPGAGIETRDALVKWLQHPPDEPRFVDCGEPVRVRDFLRDPFGNCFATFIPVSCGDGPGFLEALVIAPSALKADAEAVLGEMRGEKLILNLIAQD